MRKCGWGLGVDMFKVGGAWTFREAHSGECRRSFDYQDIVTVSFTRNLKITN